MKRKGNPRGRFSRAGCFFSIAARMELQQVPLTMLVRISVRGGRWGWEKQLRFGVSSDCGLAGNEWEGIKDPTELLSVIPKFCVKIQGSTGYTHRAGPVLWQRIMSRAAWPPLSVSLLL